MITKERIDEIFYSTIKNEDSLVECLVWQLSHIIDSFSDSVEFAYVDNEDSEIIKKEVGVSVEAMKLLYQIYKDAE